MQHPRTGHVGFKMALMETSEMGNGANNGIQLPKQYDIHPFILNTHRNHGLFLGWNHLNFRDILGIFFLTNQWGCNYWESRVGATHHDIIWYLYQVTGEYNPIPSHLQTTRTKRRSAFDELKGEGIEPWKSWNIAVFHYGWLMGIPIMGLQSPIKLVV